MSFWEYPEFWAALREIGTILGAYYGAIVLIALALDFAGRWKK